MTSPESRAKIVELLGAYCTVPSDDEAPLEIDSLSLIQFVEELEIAFDLRVLPSEATPAHFGSVAKVMAYVRGKTS